METVRLPRFSRAPDIRPFRLTDRDLEILRHVNRHRFLRSSHLIQLLPGSPQQILRRLQLLYHHGYLERPRAQLDYFHRHGSEPLVYGLGKKASEVLWQDTAGEPQVLNWTWKNQTVGRLFLDHALLVADVLVAFELAVRKRSDVRLLWSEQLFPERNQRALQWRVTSGHDQKLGVVPDAVFALETTTDDGSPERVCYFLEADRGTMPIVRQNPRQSSFARKLRAYHATWKQGLHRTRLGVPRFRVLTVTTSAERLQSMVEACARLDGGRGLFLFAESTYIHESNLLTAGWKTVLGEETRLIAQA
jgi:Replication-relaxation